MSFAARMAAGLGAQVCKLGSAENDPVQSLGPLKMGGDQLAYSCGLAGYACAMKSWREAGCYAPAAGARGMRQRGPGPLRGEPLQCSKRANRTGSGLTPLARSDHLARFSALRARGR